MRFLLACLCFVLVIASQSRAENEPAGEFDYYMLSLSWSPNWCKLDGDAKNSDQCDPRHDFGWVLHGLWPQYENGWPSYCRTTAPNPPRSLTNGMADIMGTSGLAWYQWKKHGRCSGLNAEDYFATARQAFESVQKPAVLRKVSTPLAIPPIVIEAAFIEANPHLQPDGITITCKANHIQEARICLTKLLEPRECGADVRRDCTAPSPLFTPIR
ncbi:ribonuclease T [Falsihalocynthiibacter sp. SS001]|uniref:ribonuclease T2 family protein n=1 Tax=Falsihalocynthiibacter sp. SS001 TaxID=3349698 RepID=UPI0036D27653